MSVSDPVRNIGCRARRLALQLALISVSATSLVAQQSQPAPKWHVGVLAGYVLRGGDQFAGRTNSGSVGALVGRRRGHMDLQAGIAYSRHCNPDPTVPLGTTSLSTTGLLGACPDSEHLTRVFVEPRRFFASSTALAVAFVGGHLGFLRQAGGFSRWGGEFGLTMGYALRANRAITLEIAATGSAVYLADSWVGDHRFEQTDGWAGLSSLWINASVVP